ncbi:MAG: hypothetical protein GY941_07065 [Planctomycetes bacterium]|nr:hypothetical protein [Planctomycetota bacterium]
MKTLILILAGVLFTFQVIYAQEDAVQSTILTADTVSWDKGDFKYPAGQAKITVQKIEIFPQGKELSLSFHCHTMPLAAYVTKGSVRVIKLSGEVRTFREGEAFIEVMNTWHKGIFKENSELIVFYAGNSHMPLSIKKDEDSDATTFHQ